jgi:hypothetical protein
MMTVLMIASRCIQIGGGASDGAGETRAFDA